MRKVVVGRNLRSDDYFANQAVVVDEHYKTPVEPLQSVPVAIDYNRFDEFQLRSQLKEFDGYVDFSLVQQLAKFNADQVLGRMNVADVEAVNEEEYQ